MDLDINWDDIASVTNICCILVKIKLATLHETHRKNKFS